jgi:hypothetical protein
MLSDPQSLVLNASTLSVPAIGRSLDSSVYKATSAISGITGDVSFSVSHQFKRRNRYVVRIDYTTNTADPFIPANYVRASASVYLVIDTVNDNTISNTTVGYMVAGLAAWLTTGSNAANVVLGNT